MSARSRHAALLLAALTLAACSAQETTRTGFLGPADLLAEGDSLAFSAAPGQLAGYRSALIEIVDFRPGPAAAAVEPAVIEGLRTAYREALEAAFAERGYAPAMPAEATQPGTLRVRAAVTGFERANVPLNVLTSLVIAPVTAGGAASEAEVLDGPTGSRLVALATHSNATPFLGGPHNYYVEHGHARAALVRHAGALAARLPAREPAR
jgi:hypothetical protein